MTLSAASAQFALTQKQTAANAILAGQSTHVMGFGGSRSGKTFLFCRAIVIRALKAQGSRHAILRHQFNDCKRAIAMDTFPSVMAKCFPTVQWSMNKSDWYATIMGSEVWFGGLDDKERTEKILGSEYATLFLNECSQIAWSAREIAVTRLAQRAPITVEGHSGYLPLKMYYDENPPDKGHWTYRVFLQNIDPETRAPLANARDFAYFQINPTDNLENLPDGYVRTLEGLSTRMRRRFLHGEFRDANPQALFAQEYLDKWRVTDQQLPEFQRVVVAVDPSGSGDTDNADNDAIGIVVAALGTDGNGYLLEDLTVKAGPATWGKIATAAYERHEADVLVAEVNYGGAMVKQVIQTARPRTHYKEVRASRGKVVRAEPVAALIESGKVRMAGYFNALEDELSGFTTNGYIGEGSPNRADAFVWAFAELFPGIIMQRKEKQPVRQLTSANWMVA